MAKQFNQLPKLIVMFADDNALLSEPYKGQQLHLNQMCAILIICK